MQDRYFTSLIRIYRIVRHQMDPPYCSNCSIFIGSTGPSVVNDEDSLPLLPPRGHEHSYLHICFLALLLLFFLVGMGIGTYLLFTEDERGPADKLELVSRSDWGAHPSNGVLHHLKQPVSKVTIADTNGLSCGDSNSCQKEVYRLQLEGMKSGVDIAYNFLVAGDERIYEGCGGEYQSRFGESLSIALIGNFEDSEVPSDQVRQLSDFLQILIDAKILEKCYTVAVEYNPKRNQLNIIKLAEILQMDDQLNCKEYKFTAFNDSNTVCNKLFNDETTNKVESNN